MNMSFLHLLRHLAAPRLAGDPPGRPSPSASPACRIPRSSARMLEAVALPGGRRLPAPGRLGRTTSSATPTPPRTRASTGRTRRGHRRRAGHRALRHAARHRRRRRAAHHPVADPDRQATTPTWELRAEAWDDHRAMIGGSDAGAHLDRMCGATVPHPLPRRHAPRPQAGAGRAGRAAHDPGPRRAVRPRATAGTLDEGKPRRHRRHRPRDRGLRARPHGRRPARRLRSASPPTRSAWSGCSSTAPR